MTTRKIYAVQMTDRDDRSIRGHLLPWAPNMTHAARQMRVSRTAVRTAVRGKTGWVALLSDPPAAKLACCLSIT